MENPELTVLMPAFNASAYLKDAIDSILNQSFKDFEFIIINDGSTDDTEQIILNYQDSRIRYVKHNTNLKLIRSLNDGLSIARGKYIARMDADDISLPNRLQLQKEFLDNHENVGVVSTWFCTFDNKGNEQISKYALYHEEIKFRQLYNIQICHGACMMRKSMLEELSIHFDSNYQHAEDYELFTRLSQFTELANIDYVGYLVRKHDQEVSIIHESIQTNHSIKVQKREFLKLGYNISEIELSDFVKLNYQDYFNIEMSANDIHGLLVTLIERNKQTQYLSIDYLNEKIAQLWYHYCYNLKLGKLYFSSTLSNSTSSISVFDKLKMKIKV